MAPLLFSASLSSMGRTASTSCWRDLCEEREEEVEKQGETGPEEEGEEEVLLMALLTLWPKTAALKA